MDPKRDLDELVNAEGDPEEFIAALLQVDPNDADEPDSDD
jgi:hypothetical protein